MSDSKDSTCIGYRCDKKATLHCPNCLKLDIKDAYFCGQACFKDNWATHKVIHDVKPKSACRLIFKTF